MDKITENIKHFLKTEITPQKAVYFVISLIVPIIIMISTPLGMNLGQSFVVAVILLVIIWWSTGIVKTIPASIFLLVIFSLFHSAPLKTIYSFPLSDTFYLIALTYLFSKGIENSGLVDKIFGPMLQKYATTPIRILVIIIIMYILTMYMIPQPLARLIIVAMLFRRFLVKTDTPKDTISILMFGCFIFYAVVNMATKNADIIMNNASVFFAELTITDIEWMKYMAVPVFLYGILIFILFCFIFKKFLFGIQIRLTEPGIQSKKLDAKDKVVLVEIIITIVLWMTEPLHGTNSVLVTLFSVVFLFIIKVLERKDFSSIDISTMIFLTAAFSIGGVMKASGAADLIFTKLAVLFPQEYSIYYIVVVIFVGMLMHMILGSNTTTLSVVIPGLIITCQNVLPPEIIMFTVFNSVAFHSILPFHSAAIMIGVNQNYFPARYVRQLGIPVTFLIYFVTIFIFVPWWKLIGLF